MFRYIKGGVEMLKLFATLASLVGGAVSTLGANGCIMFYIDEPECPKSLIEK